MNLPNSLWAASAVDAIDTPALAGHHGADVVIVGGGFAGLSSALHLAEAGKSVIVLEANEPGWGASGRNGGQVNPGWRMLPSEIAAKYGSNRTPAVLDMLNRACDLTFDLIDRHQMSCDAERPGFVHAGFGRFGKAFLDSWIAEWGEFGVKIDRIDNAGLKHLIGTDLYHLGMLDPRGGHVQPMSYARELARTAAAKGAVIHGDSRVTAIHEEGAGWRVATAGGDVEAEHVILCTNGYTDGAWPGLAKTVVPLTSFIAASEPLDAARLAAILPGRHAVAETRRALHYFRLDRDNRFVIGGRGNFTNLNEPGSVEHLKRMAPKIFPALEGIGWSYRWGGQIAVTPDHTPRLFKLARNVHAGVAFNGRGVAMGSMFGTQLTRVVMGEEPDMPIAADRHHPQPCLPPVRHHLVPGDRPHAGSARPARRPGEPYLDLKLVVRRVQRFLGHAEDPIVERGDCGTFQCFRQADEIGAGVQRHAQIKRRDERAGLQVVNHQASCRQGDAAPQHCRRQGHGRDVEDRALRCIDPRDAHGAQPHIPIRRRPDVTPALVVQQRVMNQIFRTAQRMLTLQQGRAAYRRHAFGHQWFLVEAGVTAGAVAQADIGFIGLQIDDVRRGRHVHLDIRILLLEILDARQQPARGKGRRGRDDKPHLIVQRRQTPHRPFEDQKTVAQARQQQDAGRAQLQLAVMADEEFVAQAVFQRANLMADRRRRDVELRCRVLEAEQSARRLEGAQPVQGQSRDRHNEIILDEKNYFKTQKHLVCGNPLVPPDC